MPPEKQIFAFSSPSRNKKKPEKAKFVEQSQTEKTKSEEEEEEGNEPWSSGNGIRPKLRRLWVRIPAPYVYLLDGHFSHLFVVKI